MSRAISAGNAAAIGVVDFLEYFADDPETAVGLGYLEGVEHGRALYERMHDAAAHRPLVLVKGGVTEQGGRAAASHTGALATDDRVFRGACRQAGVSLATTVEEGFEVAATFATQPLPAGPNTVVLTTAGGWGVLTADAITRSQLHLLELPGDLGAAIDAKLPPRWSRGNPIDLAAAETRDTIPEVLELVACHPEVDAVIFVGLGVQSNEARIMRDGPFAEGHGLDRIASFHERQDARYAAAAAEISETTGKPILCATELAVSDPDNPGPAGVRATRSLLRLVGAPRGARARAAVAARAPPRPETSRDARTPLDRGVPRARRGGGARRRVPPRTRPERRVARRRRRHARCGRRGAYRSRSSMPSVRSTCRRGSCSS